MAKQKSQNKASANGKCALSLSELMRESREKTPARIQEIAAAIAELEAKNDEYRDFISDNNKKIKSYSAEKVSLENGGDSMFAQDLAVLLKQAGIENTGSFLEEMAEFMKKNEQEQPAERATSKKSKAKSKTSGQPETEKTTEIEAVSDDFPKAFAGEFDEQFERKSDINESEIGEDV